MTFTLPTSAEIAEIERSLLPRLEAGRVGLELFPAVSKNAAKVFWEQRDNIKGTLGFRGQGGPSVPVQQLGMNRFEAVPGHWGSMIAIGEQFMNEGRRVGTFGDPIDLSEETAKLVEQLNVLRLDEIERMNWDLMTSGRCVASRPDGSIGYVGEYTLNGVAVSVPWSTVATATPFRDLQTAALKSRGQSTKLDSSATLYVNQTVANSLLNNTNASDLGGKFRLQFGQALASVGSIEDVNKLLLINNLPQIAVYDAGYINSAGTFTTFLGDTVGVVVGKRANGAPVGEFVMTRNAMGGSEETSFGPYTVVYDTRKLDFPPPPEIQVHHGFNAAHAIYYPLALVKMTNL